MIPPHATHTPLSSRFRNATRFRSVATLAIAMLAFALTFTVPVAPAAHAACTSADQSGCNSASNTGSGVDVSGSTGSHSNESVPSSSTTVTPNTSPGGSSSSNTSGFQSSGNGVPAAAPTRPAAGSNPLANMSAKEKAYWAAKRELKSNEPTCRSYGTCAPAPPPTPSSSSTTTGGSAQSSTATSAGKRTITRTVTTTDIARFTPRAPGAYSEPGTWTVAHVPTNFVLTVASHTVTGRLLGLNAEVRFTPVGSRWRHSDGAVVNAGTIGRSWASLGQAEFTTTGTSHVYRATGTYTIATAVVYTAEYRVGTAAWKPVSGTIVVDGPILRLTAFGSRTALVERHCLQSSGPGCG